MISELIKCYRLFRTLSWDGSQIQRDQLLLLRRLMEAASAEVPMYREKFAAAGIRSASIDSVEAFRRVPLLSKDEIRANFPDRIVSEREDWEWLNSIATSGTTSRVMTFHSEKKREWDRAADLLLEFWGNGWRPGWRKMVIPPDACYERCGVDQRSHVQGMPDNFGDVLRSRDGRCWQKAQKLVRLVLRNRLWELKVLKGVEMDETVAAEHRLEEYLQEIRDWRPSVLSGQPQSLLVLAKHAQRRSHPKRLAGIVRSAGGKMTGEMSRVVQSALGQVRENFGTAELGTVAFDCPRSRQQHLLTGLYYLEFLRAGLPVAPGELGELVITDLRNFAAPFIRYSLGDEGRYYDERCECGFEGMRFSVAGRLDETIVTPEGRAFSSEETVDLFLRSPEIDYVKVIQKTDDHFLVEAIMDPALGDPSPEFVLSERLGKLLGRRVTVQLRLVRRIGQELSGI